MGWFSRSKRDPQAEFAGKVLDQVRRAGMTDAWIDQDEFAIRYRRAPEDEAGWIYLENTFRECQGENRKLTRQLIDRLVSAVLNPPAMPETWAEVRDHLRPVIRSVSFGAVADERMPLLSRPVLPFLNELIVVDTPDSMAYVIQSRLAEWGVSQEQVFHTARENLAAIAAAQRRPERADGPQIIRIMDDGNAYAVSMLLLDGWLAGFAEIFGGPVVAFIPDNNTVIIANDIEEGVGQLLELVEQEYMEAPRSISPQAYTVDDSGAVIAYPIREGHQAAKQLRRAATILATGEYTAQKETLDRREDGPFVAEYMAYNRDDGSLFSVTVWGDGVDSLLPQTEFIAFARPDEAFYVSWEAVAQLVTLNPEPGYRPARFRVGPWPSNVDALRSLAVTL